jgi:predicted cupin superfamily sugar epimerase
MAPHAPQCGSLSDSCLVPENVMFAVRAMTEPVYTLVSEVCKPGTNQALQQLNT